MTNKLWLEQFGDEYQKRHTVDDDTIKPRYFLWNTAIKAIADNTQGHVPSSYIELGCGTGPNLIAIKNIFQTAMQPVILTGVEPNLYARKELQDNQKIAIHVRNGDICEIPFSDGFAEVAFTCGVLIHVEPKELLKAMSEVYRVSKRFVICAEYFAPECRELTYRGKKGAMWANDFGSLYLDNFNLRVISCGFMWKRITGLDNITLWIFEKVN